MLHLATRFFGFISSTPLSPAEQQWVHDCLASDALRSLFFAQRSEDQRHAVAVARAAGGPPDRTEAALLHDVGKSSVGLGAVGRSFATVWNAMSMPVTGEFKAYLAHGELGASMIEDAGGSPLAVAFARHHPGQAPPGVDRNDWAALEAADEGR
ncbi:MAG: hypothetical protein QNJ71_04840 [Acidimicrobiia bacterium]|nr:hypothetical protein [Acidimicrobiia bacterium]